MTPSKRKCSLCFSTEHDKRWHRKRLQLMMLDDIVLFVRLELEYYMEQDKKWKADPIMRGSGFGMFPSNPAQMLKAIGDNLESSCVIGGERHLFNEKVGENINPFGDPEEVARCVHCGRTTTHRRGWLLLEGQKLLTPSKVTKEELRR